MKTQGPLYTFVYQHVQFAPITNQDEPLVVKHNLFSGNTVNYINMEAYITSGKAMAASRRFRKTGPPAFDTKDYRGNILVASRIPIRDNDIQHNAAANLKLMIAYNMWKMEKAEDAMTLFDSVPLVEYQDAVAKIGNSDLSLGRMLSAYLSCALVQRPVDGEKVCEITNMLTMESCDTSDEEERVLIQCINNVDSFVSLSIVEQYYNSERWRMYPYVAVDLAAFLCNRMKQMKEALRVYRWAYANTTYFSLYDLCRMMLLEYECNQELSISQSAWQGVVDLLGHKANTNWLLHFREMLDQKANTGNAQMEALLRVLKTFPDNKTFEKEESFVYGVCSKVLQKANADVTTLHLAQAIQLSDTNGVARCFAAVARNLQQRRELSDIPEDVWQIKNIAFTIYRLKASKIPPSTFYKEENPIIEAIYKAEQLNNEDSKIALLQYDVLKSYIMNNAGVYALYHARCGNIDLLLDLWRHIKTSVFPQLLLKPLDIYDGLPATEAVEEEESKDEELMATVDARVHAFLYYIPCVLLTLQKKPQDAIAYCSALLNCKMTTESMLIVRYALARNALVANNHALFSEQRALIEAQKSSVRGGQFMVPTLLGYLDDAAKGKEGIPLFI